MIKDFTCEPGEGIKENYGEVHKKNIGNKQCKTNSEKTEI